jgi:hypothetical protein
VKTPSREKAPSAVEQLRQSAAGGGNLDGAMKHHVAEARSAYERARFPGAPNGRPSGSDRARSK